MKSVVLILFTLLFAIPCFAQTNDNDTLSLDLKKKYLKNNQTDQYPSLNQRKLFDEEISIKDKSYINSINNSISVDSKQIDMNLNVPKFYQGPSNDIYLSNSLNPYWNDYRYYNNISLNNKSWISTYSAHDTYLTVGSLTEIKAAYNYAINKNLTVSAGSYIAKYNLDGITRNDMGINAALKYQINEKFMIHAFGQYSGFARKYGLDMVDRWNMAPTTNFGGAFEYKITDKFGVMGGMSRELNPMNGKWKNVPFIMPIFYGK